MTPRRASSALSGLLATALAIALALAFAPRLADAKLVHVPLHRRDVPAHRLFSHARRPWYIQLQERLAADRAANVSVTHAAEHTTPIHLMHLPPPAPAAPAAPAVRAAAPEAEDGSTLPAQKMRGNMTPVGEYFLILTFAGQPIHVQVDTGSATTAVPLAACKTCRRDDRRMDPALGDTSVIKCSSHMCQKQTCSLMCPSCSRAGACCSHHIPDGCFFSLKYADGSGVSGALYEARVGVAGLTVPLAFGAILEASPDFEREQVDGIVGFSYKQLGCNPTCVLPLFDSLVAADKVDDDIFSLCSSDDGGTLTLGGSNPALYHGDLQYVPIHHTHVPMFYRVQVPGMRVNGRDPNLPDFSVGIIDSGTTLLIITKTAYNTLRDHFMTHYCDVPGLCVGGRGGSGAVREGASQPLPDALPAGNATGAPYITVRQADGAPVARAEQQTWFAPGYCVNLSNELLEKLPTVTIKLDGVDLALSPHDYMVNHLVIDTFGKKTLYRCLGIASLDGLGGMPNNVIIGNTVLRKYFVEYDRKNSRLGFAVAKNCRDPNAVEPDSDYRAPTSGSGTPSWLHRAGSMLALIGVVAAITYCLQTAGRASTAGAYQPIEAR